MKYFWLLILASYFFIGTNLLFAQQSPSYLDNPIYKRQIEFYRIYKPQNIKVVMLGNSLTHGVDWNQLLGRNDVAGMGIVSDVVKGFRNRMNYVYELKPEVCLILGGLNDIYQWTPVEDIFRDYVKVLEGMQKRGLTPIIQSTLYAGKNQPGLSAADVNAERNSQVDVLNSKLKEYAAKNNIEFIDINNLMSRGNYLRSELTYDGVHLNAAGYKIWGREIEKVFKKIGI